MQATKKPVEKDTDDRIALGDLGALDTDVYGGKDRFSGYRYLFIYICSNL